MTSANVLNCSAVNSNQTLGTNAATTKTKTDDVTMASVFASMMNMNYSTTTASDLDIQTSGNTTISQTDSAVDYERYQYQDTAIASAQEQVTVADKIVSAADELTDFKEQITDMVAEELEVTTEQVVDAMEELGVSAFDLMEPQNLAELAVTLTGADDSAALLMDSQFLNLMQDTNALGTELMEQLDIPVDQMGELIMQMDQMEQPLELSQTEFDEVMSQVIVGDNSVPETLSEGKQTAAEQAQPMDAPVIEVETDAKPDTDTELLKDPVATPDQQNTAGETEDGEAEEFQSEGRRDTGAAKPDTQTAGVAMNASEVSEFTQALEQTSEVTDTYLSTDTMDIIEQIVENVKVSISEGTSSMEMQLNPESLGKVYLQISAKEGTVNAQIAAANEAVKEMLETQVAALRENLNQAGVKVDAIEVTVASHEFEKNLEQGQRQDEQDEDGTQQQSHRRNLNLSSLDDLSGMMTEEETLAAQIMRDNGNSVDLSA